MKKKSLALILMLLFALVSLAGCAKEAEKTPAPAPAPAAEKILKMATTTSTQDSGLLDALVPEFKKDTGYTINVIAVGSGQAMEMGSKGDVDVLLVHSRAAEDKFVADGFGVNRKDVMHNDFVLIGPADDPAKIKGETDVAQAMTKILKAKATFLSRGDKSGTHTKELSLWTKANLKPEGDWYKNVGKGMGDTFRMADEMKGYTLIDRATYLALKDKYKLEIVVEKDSPMLNPYGVIAVNKAKFANVDYDGAMKFVEWITAEKAQKMIAEFGKDKYGQSLFIPDAVAIK
ncbi:MAG: substrate-binding domain-containing protein [Syntrophomonas sp.]|nr:substrate-binding domain-containing protein [Syntrophomonas sp.]